MTAGRGIVHAEMPGGDDMRTLFDNLKIRTNKLIFALIYRVGTSVMDKFGEKI